MSRALLVVPPLIKYGAGPPLGAARLAAAARASGHEVTVLDLNIRYIRRALASLETSAKSNGFVGDWDRPADGSMRTMAREYRELLEPVVHGVVGDGMRSKNLQFLQGFDHHEVSGIADALETHPLGHWMKDAMEQKGNSPEVVGISVMFAGQVFAAAAISRIAKSLWPSARVVWGGPHVSALREDIVGDVAYGAVAGADAFAFGHAEESFKLIMDAAAEGGTYFGPTVGAAGGGAAGPGKRSMVPEDGDAVLHDFDELELYGIPRLTLPIQTSKGCSYGLCTFCTYPAIEGTPVFAELEGTLRPVVSLAEEHGANVGFKDSLIPARRLRAISRIVDGRVQWGGYTKLSKSLGNADFMQELAAGGCGTLELGIESLYPPTQRFIQKPQSPELFVQVLEAAASTESLNIVINYMSGFPHEDPAGTQYWVDWVQEQADAILGPRALFGNRTFMLEKLAPAGRNPSLFGVEVTKEWPWSTSLEYRTVGNPGDFAMYR